MANLYELSYWLRSDSNPENDEKQILEFLEKHKCEIEANLFPKKKNFAYPINKELFGYLGTIYFRAEKSVLPKIEKILRSMPKVVRFLIIKVKSLPNNLPKKVNENQESANLQTLEAQL